MGLDSVELLMEFENAFQHEVPNAQAEKMTTISDATDYFFYCLSIQPQETAPAQKLFGEFAEYFVNHFAIAKNAFIPENLLKDVLPFKNRKQLWLTMEKNTGYKLPHLNKADFEPSPKEKTVLLGYNLFTPKPAFTDSTIQKFIDTVFSLNYARILNLPVVSSRYEIERVIVGITSDKCGIPVEEIETHHSFVNDLGID